MPEYIPFPPPDDAIDNVEPERSLTTEQEEMYSKLLAHFTADGYELSVEGGMSALIEEETFWLTKDCLHRYLRASKWTLATVIQRLEDTLKWRREFGLYSIITPEHVEPEGLTGKCFIYGYDVAGRPGLLTIPSRQNTKETPRQLHFFVWMMECCIDLMGPGVETLTLLINYAVKGQAPSFRMSRSALSIIQNHYPERLGRALIINIPFVLNAFYKMIAPFIDPVTREKLKFNPDAIKDGLFTPDNLMKEWWGGQREFEWVHERYWPALVELCKERRKRRMKSWRELGGCIGLSEWDLKVRALKGQISVGGEKAPPAEVQPVLEAKAFMESVAA